MAPPVVWREIASYVYREVAVGLQLNAPPTKLAS
jgi:hypothetical protein